MPGISLNFNKASVASLLKKLDLTKKKYGLGLENGLRRAGKFLLDTSKELVPVDTGALKSSGEVNLEGKRLETTVSVSYGSDEVFYALYVHEDPVAHHAYPTQYKYLEQPARERLPEIIQIIREGVEKGR